MGYEIFYSSVYDCYAVRKENHSWYGFPTEGEAAKFIDYRKEREVAA